MSARLRRSERKRKAQAAELAEARTEAAEAKSELSRAREKAAAQAQREKAKGEADPTRQQQRQLRERDAEISRLRDRLEAATGELSEEQVRERCGFRGALVYCMSHEKQSIMIPFLVLWCGVVWCGRVFAGNEKRKHVPFVAAAPAL